jgi:hypothetical protein
MAAFLADGRLTQEKESLPVGRKEAQMTGAKGSNNC